MKEVFPTFEEAREFLNDKVSEQKYVVGMKYLPTGEYSVEWQEHKNYTAYDGTVYPDEVWVTEDQRMLLIQDIEPEHCRNILRMMLRQEREIRDRVELMAQSIMESVDTEFGDDLNLLDMDNNPPPDGTVLH